MQSTRQTRRTTSLKSTQLPQRPKFQFIPRNLKYNQSFTKVIKKAILKGVYIHRILEESHYLFEEEVLQETPQQRYVHSKLFKGLRHLTIASLQKSYWQETLKRSKRLVTAKVVLTDQFATLEPVSQFLKRLPKGIKEIKLDICKNEQIQSKNVYKIPKALSSLRDLRVFQRSFIFAGDQEYVPKELGLYHKHTRRLRNLKRLVYDQNSGEQKGLQKYMKGNIANPGITELRMYLTAADFENYRRFEDIYGNFEEPEEVKVQDLQVLRATGSTEGVIVKPRKARSQDNSMVRIPLMNLNLGHDEVDSEQETDNEEGDIGEEMPVRSGLEEIMERELSPFFKFSLFPNLVKLDLQFEDALYPLGSFVVKGFQALQNLKELNIDLISRSIRTKYIFQGLLNLPMLKTFTVRINRLKVEDWGLIIRFLEKQRELETFGLYIRLEKGAKVQYLQQNQCLEALVKTFKEQKCLRNLDIQSAYWSLETLSNALKHLKMPNQLRILRLQGSDDTIITKEKHWKRVEGLCQFIKSQGKSLKELYLRFPLVLEENVLTHVSEAMAKMKELKKLTLLINNNVIYAAMYPLKNVYSQVSPQ